MKIKNPGATVQLQTLSIESIKSSWDQGRYDEALQQLKSLLAIESQDEAFFIEAGQKLLKMGYTQLCFNLFEYAITKYAFAPYFVQHIDDTLQEHSLEFFIKQFIRFPNRHIFRFFLGHAHQKNEDFASAEHIYNEMLMLSLPMPILKVVLHELLNIYTKQLTLDKTTSLEKNCLLLFPHNVDFLSQIGLIHLLKQQPLKALPLLEEAFILKPKCEIIWNHLIHAYHDSGDLYNARKVITDNPSLQLSSEKGAHLFFLLSMPELSRQEIFKAHKRVGINLEKTIQPLQLRKKAKEKRTLRIGYVSPDFRHHSVAFFIYSILKKHGPNIQNICYSNSPNEDFVTASLKKAAHSWRPIFGLSDIKACELILQDEIDILVDLAGYTRSDRISLFAYKPAPIQASYCGYPSTTGLTRIDYRIVDSYTDPPENNHLATERLIRLPNCFLCYSPPIPSPEIINRELHNSSVITFGSLNNVSKLNRKTLETWARIYTKLTKAKFVIKNKLFNNDNIRSKYYNLFEDVGIPMNHVDLLPYQTDMIQHLKTYDTIDIALDTFPYNGTTTTFEALWMGVPVVTLVGDQHLSRVSYSILSQLGLDDCIAFTAEEYVNKALVLANNSEHLINLRQNLRPLISSSPLMNTSLYEHLSIYEKFRKPLF